MSFAEDIKKLRLSAILTQEEFAKEVGGICYSEPMGNWKIETYHKSYEADRRILQEERY